MNRVCALTFAGAVASVLLPVADAEAVLTLRIQTDAPFDLTIVDNDLNDLNSDMGTIEFDTNNGSIVGSAEVTGVSNADSQVLPINFDLQSDTEAVGSQGGQVIFTVTEDNFMVPVGAGTFEVSVAATQASNGLTYDYALTIDGNALAGATGLSSLPDFYVDSITIDPLSNPYTIEQSITANFNAGSSFDVSASVSGTAVPEPTTLALLGVGLLGAGVAARSRRLAIRNELSDRR